MNVVMVMSGGVGNRFGTIVPKQYNLIAGKPVIDYVIEAVQDSRKTDQLIVVCDSEWRGYSKHLSEEAYALAENGPTRLHSFQNGLNKIKELYPCENLVVVDAVAPLITGEIIDTFFDYLKDYDAVITAQRITGGLTDINSRPLDRDQFIVTQSPEGFKFDLLYDCFDVDFPYQETACMLPDTAKRFYYYDFPENLKLTYESDLKYAEFKLFTGKVINYSTIPFFSIELLKTKGLRSYLLRNEREKTEEWLKLIYDALPGLIERWRITYIYPDQSSRFGLVIKAKSDIYGYVILKFIPEFVGRYEREREAMQCLSNNYMVKLLDWEDKYKVLLLEQILPGTHPGFNKLTRLGNFFQSVKDYAPKYSNQQLKYIPFYNDELLEKIEDIETVPYQRESVLDVLLYAKELWNQFFSDSKDYYILHTDLHSMNLLENGPEIAAIDPYGAIGPIELEYVRFIRNDVRDHAEEGFEARFLKLIDFFCQFVSRQRLLAAFIIDMAFCTWNSTFENETEDETLVDLELIRIAKEVLSET